MIARFSLLFFVVFAFSAEFVAAKNVDNALVKVPQFANKQLAFQHYAKHSKGIILKNGKTKLNPRGADLPQYSSLDEYVGAAQRFHSGAPGKGVLEWVRGNGDIIRFDPSIGNFGVRTQDGIIRTFFKPEGGLQYFLDQF